MTQNLFEFLDRMQSCFVLTGAGISTASGIPDYRDEKREWKHQQPMQFQEFASSVDARQRYWARSAVGWQRMRLAQPNAAHEALVNLETHKKLSLLVTQNVDGLHQRAGSRRLIDLHGNLDQVICLDCGRKQDRGIIQHWMMEQNHQLSTATALSAPDGDAYLQGIDVSMIKTPECELCSGPLKPDVVFYGENVPVNRVEDCYTALQQSDSMLVVGSSLSVFSGFRFVKRAKQLNIPIAMINIGQSRADELIDLKIESNCNEILPELVERLV